MQNLPLDRPAGVLVKTTCVDFPGLLASSFFLTGCNLRCPYCYNHNLVILPDNCNTAKELCTINDLFAHLEKRRGILSGLVISGGEPLLNPYTPLIIQKARKLGYKIKLDTNGTLPDELDFFLSSSELQPDFLAIDIKATAEDYATKICNPKSKFFGNPGYFEKLLRKTKNLAEGRPSETTEYRTVLVPSLINKENIKKIADFVPEKSSWKFAQFQNTNCLNPEYNNLCPYTDAEIQEIIEAAKQIVPDSTFR